MREMTLSNKLPVVGINLVGVFRLQVLLNHNVRVANYNKLVSLLFS